MFCLLPCIIQKPGQLKTKKIKIQKLLKCSATGMEKKSAGPKRRQILRNI